MSSFYRPDHKKPGAEYLLPQADFVAGNALDFLNDGNAHYAAGRYEEAINNYTQVILLDPTNHIAFLSRGDAKNMLTHYAAAIDDYTRAILLDPTDHTAFLSRGDAKSELGWYAEAIVDYDRAILLNPTHTLAFLMRGDAKCKLRLYAEAIVDYDQAIRLGTTDPTAFVNRGNAKFGLGRYEEAIKDYDQSITLNSDDDVTNALCYLYAGHAKTKLGQYAEALEDYKAAAELDPNNESAQLKIKEFSNLLTLKGDDEFKLRHYQEAIKYYAQAIELDPSNIIAIFNRGEAHFECIHFQKAIADYDRVITLNPIDQDKAIVFFKRGSVKFRLKRYKETIEDFNQAIALNKLDSDYTRTCFFNRGNAYFECGEIESRKDRYKDAIGYYQSAIKDYEEAMDLYPLNVQGPTKSHYQAQTALFIAQGNDQFMSGKFKQALDYYDQAVILDPLNATLFSNRGDANYLLDRLEAAIKDYNQVLLLRGDSKETRLKKGYLSFRLGDYVSAGDCFKRLLASKDDPTYIFAIQGIGLLALQEGRTQEAQDYFKQVDGFINDTSKPVSEKTELLVYQSQARAHLGQLHNAKNLLEEALLLQPNNRGVRQAINNFNKGLTAAQRASFKIVRQRSDFWSASVQPLNHSASIPTQPAQASFPSMLHTA
jgi:tetratricopeptide (TPR) repeat protein